MLRKKTIAKSTAVLVAVVCALSAVFTVFAGTYIPTNRDTKTAPETAQLDPACLTGFALLYETDSVRYYYRDDRDIFMIEDKATGYFLKTGVDMPFSDEAKDAVKALKKSGASTEEILAAAESYPDDLNTTYLGIANSLITVEYYNGSKTKYISSASQEGASSTLYALEGTENQFVLKVDFSDIDLQLNVYITLEECSIRYDIPREEFTGAGISSLMAIDITPFLGASGGTINVLDPETLSWESVENYRVPGYVFVPDGSGALIRFADNTATFNPYVGDVYGKDYSTETYYYSTYYDAVPVNDPVMPVFGIAQGDDQLGFVAWADSGAEYMEIIVNPDETKSTTYTWAYPRFEYNVTYYQLYDELGNGFFTQLDEIYDYDVSMTYSFLFGDGSGTTQAANYVGMARTYREHLLSTGELTLLQQAQEEIPIRLDFIMADSESGIIGTNQVVVTTADDVRQILTEISQSGITNISSGLIGWQRKGETLSKPGAMRFSAEIGTKHAFASMISDMEELGIEVSFSRDFATINSSSTGYYNTAVKCASNWYVTIYKDWILPDNLPTTTFSYATPARSVQWLRKIANGVGDFSTGLTVSGMTNVLTANYNRSGVQTTLTEAIALYREALADISEELTLNLENPNKYLWKYTDRYLQMPVGNSQYIYETDAVPFLQIVLNGTMEMYAPYANFSFYTQESILRMIDYNVCPSFILSAEPAWNLADSYSASLYSTEYSLYREKITDIYDQINAVLSRVQGYEWVQRSVPEVGVVINGYCLDGQMRYVIINYTDHAVGYLGTTVAAQSAAVAD